jgi:hypothetical protein
MKPDLGIEDGQTTGTITCRLHYRCYRPLLAMEVMNSLIERWGSWHAHASCILLISIGSLLLTDYFSSATKECEVKGEHKPGGAYVN